MTCELPCNQTVKRFVENFECVEQCTSMFLVNETHCFVESAGVPFKCDGYFETRLYGDSYNMRCEARVDITGIVFGTLTGSLLCMMVIMIIALVKGVK